MRIVLINPWNPEEEGAIYSSDYQKYQWRNAYYGLVQLATYINRHGHEAYIIDGERDLLIEASGNPVLLLERMRRKLLDFAPDLIGVTGMSFRYPAISRILDMVEPLGIRAVIGGHHARGVPQSCLEEHPFLDCAFYGMAETGLKRYMDGARLSELPGIVFRNGSGYMMTPPETVCSMDDLPMPDWDHIDVSFYTHPCVWLHRSVNTLVRNLDTICSRGCSYSCNFCGMTGIRDNRPAWHSVERIREYLFHIRGKYGVNATMFQDSSLGNNPEFLHELCDMFMTSGLNRGFVWNANMRANQITEELARLMYRAGCRMVFIGFESASDRILKAMSKGVTAEENRECARALEKAGMPYWASFVAGYPGETEEDLLATMQFAHSINPIGGGANEFNPAPGTRIFNTLMNEGKIRKPVTPEEWAEISIISRDGAVGYGHWSSIEPERFRDMVNLFQLILQEKLNRGMNREIPFDPPSS